ncbi:hypothetical protein HK101_006979 [Irineochytrium annulatum]|nr:hypothetical protein HK101_006979 [Irineochytrium annulatum]
MSSPFARSSGTSAPLVQVYNAAASPRNSAPASPALQASGLGKTPIAPSSPAAAPSLLPSQPPQPQPPSPQPQPSWQPSSSQPIARQPAPAELPPGNMMGTPTGTPGAPIGGPPAGPPMNGPPMAGPPMGGPPMGGFVPASGMSGTPRAGGPPVAHYQGVVKGIHGWNDAPNLIGAVSKKNASPSPVVPPQALVGAGTGAGAAGTAADGAIGGEVARVMQVVRTASLVDPSSKKIVDDTDKRVEELIQRLATNSVPEPCIMQLRLLAQALKAGDLAAASAASMQLTLLSTAHSTEGRWIIGIKRLLELQAKYGRS